VQQGVGGEVGAELVEAAGIARAAQPSGGGLEAVHDGGDAGGVGGHGQPAHPVVGEPAEHPAPGPGVRVPRPGAAGIDRRDRPTQPGGEGPLRHRLPVAGRGEHGLRDRRDVRVRELGGVGGDLQRPVQRQPTSAQRVQDDPVPAGRGRQGESAGDLPGADTGREGDLLGDDPLGRDPRGHPGQGPDREGVDLVGLDAGQRAVRGEQVGLEARLGDLERLDLGQHPLPGPRQPLQRHRCSRALTGRHPGSTTGAPLPARHRGTGNRGECGIRAPPLQHRLQRPGQSATVGRPRHPQSPPAPTRRRTGGLDR